MFTFYSGQGLVEHIVISHGLMVGNYVEKKDVMLDEKISKNCQRGKKNKSFMFLRFYVERAWNQKK